MSSGIATFTIDHLFAENKETGERTPLRIRSSACGYYIGTPEQRMSEYYETFELAEEDLICGTFGCNDGGIPCSFTETD